MAKKKKGKVIQMLTPENYIKQKARSLPVFECWVNSEWDENGMANILVGRKHTNGNITAGMYLVDLKCLGVKDAHYWFNIAEYEFREILEYAMESMEMEECSYTLAHNIIYAGLEYAEDYGFKPHKDFTSVAQYILDEDSDDIELMEINCGLDGKPAYVRGPYDSWAKMEGIVEQLEKTAGPGNYMIIDEELENLPDMEDSDDADEDDLWDGINEDEEEDFGYTPIDTTFQIKVELAGVSDPKVWRRLTLPSNYTFIDFHTAIQIAFGWEDAHLYMFSPKGFGSYPQITELTEDDMDNMYEKKLNADELILSDIFKTEKQKYTYIYDFGDSWKHTITLEKILQQTTLIPDCIDGKGKCPPEDCGGVGGYENLKEILADKNHTEYEETAEWVGLEEDELWDASEFEIEAIRKDLKTVFDEDFTFNER